MVATTRRKTGRKLPYHKVEKTMITFLLPPEQADRIRRRAKAEGRSQGEHLHLAYCAFEGRDPADYGVLADQTESDG